MVFGTGENGIYQMTEFLKISGLNYSYGNDEITSGSFCLKNINAEITGNDFTAVIGKNGSGKSTLIRILAGINLPDSGDINFRGKNILSYGKKELAGMISYLPQSNDLMHFDSEVKDFLMLGRFPYKSFSDFRYSSHDKEIVMNSVKITGIEDLLIKKMNELSGGQRQKVLLTLSLVQLGTIDDMKGKLLIADEPLTHLDINHQIEIMNLLKQLNENNLTVIIVIHDLNLALKYSNKSILLRQGEIVKFTDTKEVITEGMIKEHFFIDSKILNYEKNFFINYLPN